ncbi:hypothetical protein H6P81_010734 [Aristolochia fimbriata]|uniref:HXXXD-type acyl-transferase family protein n=1 Tax=Aristolochia fimbriata TaxID=158543 RepID=A0AAV7EQ85_ARIFI|nr:hypothetical protein H6P81_010734 [Aristolochia fimbriata]
MGDQRKVLVNAKVPARCSTRIVEEIEPAGCGIHFNELHQAFAHPFISVFGRFKMEHLAVRRISTCCIKPDPPLGPEQNAIVDLAPWDIAMLSVHYIQKGLLFHDPPRSDPPLLDRLKSSLARTLSVFYPLAGRLVTQKTESSDEGDKLVVFIDCHNGDAEFILAEADLAVSDILDPIDVPEVVKSFFPYSAAINHDSHSLPLLSVQVTELKDGVFIGCNFNHAVGDGTAFWNFFYAWGQMARIGEISRKPIIERFFLDCKSPFYLPFSDLTQHLHRHVSPPLRERMFHFSADTMRSLKSKANAQRGTTNTISSFQALCALVWQSITRARRHLSMDQNTSCRLAINNRTRLDPPLSSDYFGNCIYAVSSINTKKGELLSKDLGWAAWLLHQTVVGHSDGAVRELVKTWVEAPQIYSLSMFDPCGVMVGSSPRFDMYGCEFGCGKAVAARSGYANKFDGKVSAYPGREGGGSVDLEVCLPPETMALLESDSVFMDAESLD